MNKFQLTNSQNGFTHTNHTATGYECYANLPDSNKFEMRVKFFIRCIIGLDGRPYVELGMSGLENYEKSLARDAIKKALKKAKFSEAISVYGSETGRLVFADQDSVEEDHISIIVGTGKNGIQTIVKTLNGLIPDEAKEFISNQEKIEDVLFQSLLSKLGPELNKGPGNYDNTVKKVRQMANEFQHGLQQN